MPNRMWFHTTNTQWHQMAAPGASHESANKKQLADEICSYKEIAPVKFCTGDLVEVQLTLMLVPLRGGQYKLAPILRCLTILDSKFSQVNTR